MRYRFCPHCGMRYVSSIGGNCPHCGRSLKPTEEPQPPPADQAEAAAAGPEPPAPEPPLVPAPPEPAEPPAEASRSWRGAPSPPAEEAQPLPAAPEPAAPLSAQDGQFRCPHCGEALYAGEQVCWNCGRRVETGERVAEAVPQPGAPAPVQERGWRAEMPPGYRTSPPQGAMRSAYWSLGLGLASALTCGLFCFLGPFALWLGIRATREGAGPVAVVGLVLGALGTLWLAMALAWFILALLGFGPEFASAVSGAYLSSLSLLS